MDNFTDDFTNNFINNFIAKSTTNKYNSYRFYKVVINIKALKYSITGYKQF
jgi:hypothetical protein